MTSNLENYRSYSKLAQIHNCFENTYYAIPYFVGRVLRKDGNINYKSPATSRVQPTDLLGGTALHIAALKNHVEAFDLLLDNGADITIQNQDGRTALHLIADQAKVKKDLLSMVFNTHLSFGDPSNPCDKNGISHLHIACLNNHAGLVEFFLNSGVPIDMSVNVDSEKFAGYTPLHFAAEGCAIETCKLLLTSSANSRAKNAQGLTPFHLLFDVKFKNMDSLITNAKHQEACELMRQIDEVLNVLMDHNNYVDHLGLTHFHVACTLPNSAIAEYYLQQNIDVDQQVRMDSPLFPGYTALHFAAQFSPDIAKLLLQKKANFEVRNASGVAPMDLILRKSSPEYLRDIFAQNWPDLTFSYQQLRLVDFVSSLWKETTLRRNLQVVKGSIMSINGGPTVWACRTPLHFAATMCKNRYMLRIFMESEYGQVRDVDQRDCHGSTPIHLAFRANKLEFVDALLEYSRSKENLVDNDGLSYLHIACARRILKLVERYCLDAANLNAVCCGNYQHPWVEPGSTALHVAVASGDYHIVNALLRSKMDPQAEDANGQTPAHRLLRMTENVVNVSLALLEHESVTDEVLERVGLTRFHLAVYCRMKNAFDYMNFDNVAAVVHCDDPKSFLHEYDGCTPLHMAIKRELKFEAYAEWLEQDVDVLAVNHRGESALYTALTKNCDWDLVRWIVKKLRDNEIMRKRLEKMSGITMLHLACHIFDLSAISWLLVGNVDVQARVKSNCPVWPGWTPLHVLIKATTLHKSSMDLYDILGSILEMGANVSALNENGETPINLAMQLFSNQDMYRVLAHLVDNIKDFTVNPPGRDGMSHFHAACLVNNVGAVKFFLENGAVDVNQPIDFFTAHLSGETPLHLVVEPSCEKIFSSESRQATLDLLLEFGADVTAEDSRGLTVLHKAVRMENNVELLRKLISHDADVESRNILEQTPLELYIQSKFISIEGFKLFESTGCRLNVSNPVTEEGYISMLISEHYHPIEMSLEKLQEMSVQVHCFNVILNAADAALPDEMGRNLIHNIVTTSNPNKGLLTRDHFIKQLQSAGVDIDLRDKRGKTALHLAAQFGNHTAVQMLLDAGADVNVVDLANLTPLQYAMVNHKANHIPRKKEGYRLVIERLVSHVRVLQRLNIVVHENNCLAKTEAMTEVLVRPMFNHDRAMEMILGHRRMDTEVTIATKVASVEQLMIRNTNLRIGDFLSERGKGLIAYAFMSSLRRESVDQFFGNYKGELRDICARQYRKAIKRVDLVNSAVDTVRAIARRNVPIYCVEIIFQYLTNDELDNFVKGTEGMRVE